MKRHKVAVGTRDAVLKAYLEQRLKPCVGVELVDCPVASAATIIEQGLLTENERHLLQRLADYGSMQCAARAIPRSYTTLKRELATIREKLGVHTTLQAVVWALRNGVIR